MKIYCLSFDLNQRIEITYWQVIHQGLGKTKKCTLLSAHNQISFFRAFVVVDIVFGPHLEALKDYFCLSFQKLLLVGSGDRMDARDKTLLEWKQMPYLLCFCSDLTTPIASYKYTQQTTNRFNCQINIGHQNSTKLL